MASRVVLSPVVREDGPELVAANSASRSLHHPWVQPFSDPASFDSWFDGLEARTSASLIARPVDGGGIVGVVNLSQIVRGAFLNAYISYYGMAGFIGRGLMTEAVGAGIRYAFERLSLHRLEANIQPGNLRSIALVRRLGFRYEGFSPEYLCIGGVWRDHERWALLQREFRA